VEQRNGDRTRVLADSEHMRGGVGLLEGLEDSAAAGGELEGVADEVEHYLPAGPSTH